MKTCTKCQKTKELKLFNKSKRSKGGLSPTCSECDLSYHRLYRQKNSKELAKKKHAYYLKNYKYTRTEEREKALKWRYGLADGEYSKMFNEQNGVCSICGEKETHTIKGVLCNLCVDHKHDSKKTGTKYGHDRNKVRGLLCGNCNRALGLFKDNIDVLASAISYLKNTNIKERRTA